MPADVSSAGSVGRFSHFRNYGYETAEELGPPTNQSGGFGKSPELPERPLNWMPGPLAQSTDRAVEVNGVFSLSSLQLQERKVEEDVTVHESRAQNRVWLRESADRAAKQPVNPHERHRSRGSNHLSSKGNELVGYEQIRRGGSNLPQSSQPVMDLLTTVNAQNRGHDSIAGNSAASPRGEWRNRTDGGQEWPLSEPVYAISDKVRSRRVQAENRANSRQTRQHQAEAGNSGPENYAQAQTTDDHAVDLRNGSDGADGNSAARRGPLSVSQQMNLNIRRDDRSMGGYSGYEDVDVIL